MMPLMNSHDTYDNSRNTYNFNTYNINKMIIMMPNV